MAGSKSTQTRDNRINYTSLRLLFSTIMFFYTCFSSFFIVLSVVYQCHLLSSVIKWKLNGSDVKIRPAATLLINLRSYHPIIV